MPSHQIGIMQGRLSPPTGRRIQAFPGNGWQKEFFNAGELGLASIEWILESPLDENPLWTIDGINRIREQIDESGVRVDFVCADYFMESPMVRMSPGDSERNQSVLNLLIERAAALGVRGVEIPFVDASAIYSVAEEDELCRALESPLELAQRMNVTIGLETSLAPDRFEQLLRRINHPALRANYDIGNSASLGYDPGEEITAYGRWINNVHIKDRVRGGGTVKLGTGDADLPRVFKLLQDMDYSGSYTLQAARGADEITTVREYVRQVNLWISNSKTDAS